jgi:hypothetical protein
MQDHPDVRITGLWISCSDELSEARNGGWCVGELDIKHSLSYDEKVFYLINCLMLFVDMYIDLHTLSPPHPPPHSVSNSGSNTNPI